MVDNKARSMLIGSSGVTQAGTDLQTPAETRGYPEPPDIKSTSLLFGPMLHDTGSSVLAAPRQSILRGIEADGVCHVARLT